MKLNRSTTYAVQALAYMATHEPGRTWASHDIARERGIPERFLLKVLNPLVTARVLHSVRGPHGGYHLARPAEKITFLDVIEAVEGPIIGEGSLPEGMPAGGAGKRVQSLCDDVAEAARDRLRKARLSDLAGKRK